MPGKTINIGFIQWMIAILISGLYACTSSADKKNNRLQPTTASIEQGKKLFITRCSSCHKVNQEMTGPPLQGAETHWPDQKKLYAFIRNSEEIIHSDKYARELWLQYNQTPMPTQPDLSDIDIRAVLDYINSVSEK